MSAPASDRELKRILAMCRTKLDARTRSPWPDIQRSTAPIGGIARDLKGSFFLLPSLRVWPATSRVKFTLLLVRSVRCGTELSKALEHFHIQLNASDLVTLMNAFPTPAHVNSQVRPSLPTCSVWR
jgi:hypothetical protein